MSEYRVSAPVVFFVFNCPEKTKRVLEKIAQVEPGTLLVVADGPRDGHPTDGDRCNATRDVIDAHVTWDCEVRKNFADSNLGSASDSSRASNGYSHRCPKR